MIASIRFLFFFWMIDYMCDACEEVERTGTARALVFVTS